MLYFAQHPIFFVSENHGHSTVTRRLRRTKEILETWQPTAYQPSERLSSIWMPSLSCSQDLLATTSERLCSLDGSSWLSRSIVVVQGIQRNELVDSWQDHHQQPTAIWRKYKNLTRIYSKLCHTVATGVSSRCPIAITRPIIDFSFPHQFVLSYHSLSQTMWPCAFPSCVQAFATSSFNPGWTRRTI